MEQLILRLSRLPVKEHKQCLCERESNRYLRRNWKAPHLKYYVCVQNVFHPSEGNVLIDRTFFSPINDESSPHSLTLPDRDPISPLIRNPQGEKQANVDPKRGVSYVTLPGICVHVLNTDISNRLMSCLVFIFQSTCV